MEGVVLTDFGAPSGAEALVLQPDAKLVAAGRFSFFGGADFALARYNADGSLDASFDGDGRVLTDFAGAARALLLQPDGKLVAGGDPLPILPSVSFARAPAVMG
ncbi:MAG: delta-60 repeat domain-containing protein [Gammaproteobacteria bacterium]